MKILPTTPILRWRLLSLVFVFVLLAFFFRGQLPLLYVYASYSPQEGDIVFQSLPHNDLVDAIEGITHSPWSHCGVVLRNDRGQWVVIESIQNVHEVSLFSWILRCRDGNFAAYRLDPKYSSLLPVFKKKLLTYSGQPYDFDYDMNKGHGVYCSSLVYLAFVQASGEKLGTLKKLGDLDWQPYEAFIKSEQGGALPLDRMMITPASLARAPQLHEVYPTK